MISGLLAQQVTKLIIKLYMLLCGTTNLLHIYIGISNNIIIMT